MSTTMRDARDEAADVDVQASMRRPPHRASVAIGPPEAARDLAVIRPLVVFADGVSGAGDPAPDLLCAWALAWDGRRVLLALEAGSRDAPDSAWSLVASLKRRGLADPLVVVADGESTLLRACELAFPSALVQRCLSQQVRALGHRLPPDVTGHVLQAARAAWEAPSAGVASALRHDVARRHGSSLPTFVAYFERTFDSCTTHLNLPRPLQRVARATFVPECLAAARRRLVDAASLAATDLTALRGAIQSVLDEGRAVSLTDSDRRELELLASHLGREKRVGRG